VNGWVIADALLLFLCASIYLGTGVSLVVFQFPSRPQMTVQSYYEQFVPQVTRATRFFTWMTIVMIAAAIVLVVAEWGDGTMWAPLVVLLGVVAATVLTVAWILPINRKLAAGVTEYEVLQGHLKRWMALNTVRVALWAVQWGAMAAYFAAKLR
jgi:hypothetical protein